MKTSYLLSALVALCAAAPAAVIPDSLIGVGCYCKPPTCPLSLIAECKCKNAAAEACYQASLEKGIQCPKPVAEVCGIIA